MQIELTLEQTGKSRPLNFEFSRMVNGGYVGRNQEEVRRHIEELAKKGIPGPKTTPVLFPVITRTLVTDHEIEVYGDKTSGEVEYVLLVEDENNVYVGLGRIIRIDTWKRPTSLVANRSVRTLSAKQSGR